MSANGTQPRIAKAQRFAGVVTRTGQYVGNGVLNIYAGKQGSKQIEDRFQESYGANGLIEPLYNPDTLAQLLEVNTYHYRACKTKARDTAGLGWALEAVGDDPEAGSEANKQQLTLFFEQLSPPLIMTLDRAQLDFETIGWGALELVREGYKEAGPLATLAHVPAHTLRVHREGNRFAQIRGGRKRWFRAAGAQVDVDQDNGTVHPIGDLEPAQRGTEILWWINYTPRSDYYGLPDIMPALGALHGDLSRRDFNIAFFSNFGVPAYAVLITGDFDEGAIDEDGASDFEKAVEEHFQDLATNPHSVLLLSVPTRSSGQEVKIEFKPLAVDIKEASFRLYRADNRDEILAAHAVPPYRAGIAEVGALGGSTARESTEIYKRSVIEPRQTIIEHLFNRYILAGAFDVTDWRFKLAEIDTRDQAQAAALLGGLVDRGAAWPDELRAHFAPYFGLDTKRALPAAAEPAPTTEPTDAGPEDEETP